MSPPQSKNAKSTTGVPSTNARFGSQFTGALLIFTGQRLADVTRMSWRDIEGAGIQVVQGKTRARLWIALHPELAAMLDRWPRAHVSMLTTNFGKPLTTKGFGNWMADRIKLAGLPDRCVTHGLRKAAARRLADCGCSPHQIMAVTGHRSLKEVQRYTDWTTYARLRSIDAALQQRWLAGAMAILDQLGSRLSVNSNGGPQPMSQRQRLATGTIRLRP